MSLDEKFDVAVKTVQKLPKSGSLNPTTEQKLRFYSLYKQGTIGPNENPKPSFYQLIEKSKWEAWKALGDMDKSEAKKLYVEELLKMIDELHKSLHVEEWLEQEGTDPELKNLFAALGR
uniref:ACB domain-containing protein n=1 Tax=Syphacia muris TaxID=451379 RepID=A0A0N5AR34_9BILA